VYDSRQHPRKQLKVQPPVWFQVGDGPRVEGICRDISLGGLYIETAEPQPFGSEVRVFLVLPGLKQEVGVRATVRWTNPTGMGVQFGKMGARETHALTELLASAS
jgi:type IV pilus assembly protein PilZ